MSARDDGGRAFPGAKMGGNGEPEWESLGMTLRDYVATAAMQGLVAEAPPGARISTWASINGKLNEQHAAKLASAAFRIADAMLAARSA